MAVRLRVDARRPASWLACGGAATAVWWIAAAVPPPWRPAAAVLGGAMAAAAAAGAPPRGLPGGGAAWSISRAAWPAVGTLLAWLARGAEPGAGGVAATVLVSVGITSAAVATATAAGLGAAAAVATGLVTAAAAALAAALAASAATTSALPTALAAATGWAVAAAVAWTLRVRRVGGSPVGGPGGAAVPRPAMVSALVGMVFCLLLSPHLAAGYLALAAAWLVLDALPRASLGPGPSGDAARRMLTATAPGSTARPAWAAARLVAAYAAVLAWPPLVAAVVVGSVTAASGPLAVAALIGLGAVGIAAAVGGALASGASRETAFAVGLAAAVAGLVIGHAFWTGVRMSPASPGGLMLSNPGDPARLPAPRAEPRLGRSPRGVVTCQQPTFSASPRPSGWRRRSSS